MNLDEFRKEMEEYLRSVDEEARWLKNSQLALERLRQLYQRFDAKERAMANQVLAEWALSDKEAVRYDGLALIDDFKITTAASALRSLADRLSKSCAPGGQDERARIDRVLRKLR
jgi:cysteinyl-tRNA synthetase